MHAASNLGFALAGGYAVQAHGVLTRPSEDVDLFISAERTDFRDGVRHHQVGVPEERLHGPRRHLQRSFRPAVGNRHALR
ncbi:MAG: nucleotidyl transferase AbiEii/AbiGii toxin family protein [Streptosporangiaceae bacterium]